MQRANYEAIYLTKEAVCLEIPGGAHSDPGSSDNIILVSAPRFLSDL